MRVAITTAVAAAVLVSGCSNFANRGAIFRTTDVNDGATLIMDAEQTALINITRNESQIICSQPAPDTSAADSASAALGAGLATGDEAQIGYAAGQAVASIGLRTQSIQLLRDSYFRLCEAYQNGGIDAVEYGISMRRIQNTMIAVLAVEQLTGATVAGAGNAQSGSTANASGGDSDSAAATTSGTAATTASTTASSNASAESISDAVQTITLAAITQDYTLPLCVDMLRWNNGYNPNLVPGEPLYEYCTALIQNDLDRQEQRSATAAQIVDALLTNPNLTDGQRESMMAILANIAADGDFRGLTQLIVPDN